MQIDYLDQNVTYRTDSDIVKMYSDGLGTWPSDEEEMKLRAKLKEKNKFAVWFVSHCKTYSKREDYVKQLKEFVDIDVIGLCGRNKCPKRHKTKCLDMLTYQYKFYLAFENSLCRDYVTEKFYNALAHYIDVRDYKSPEHLAEYLLYLDANQTAYEQYFEWRKVYQPKRTSAWCQLCEMLNNPTLPSQSYKNIYNWWFQEGQCDHEASTKTSRPDISFIWRKRVTPGKNDQVDLDLLNDEYDSKGLYESTDLLDS
jgi:alpha-1,3-fucosyltransferase